MYVLSDRRDKKTWSVDPNGTNWSKDESKFGIKMLEKMGWSKGKGLGANEDGRVDHVKIKHKNDNRGVGCAMKNEKSWVAHQDDFASLLANLNDHHSDQSNVKTTKGVSNMEENSRSQKRVHYQKFARGKDLSNYKEKDLAAIFGKTVSQSAPATPINLSEGDQSDAGSTSSCPERKKKKKKKKKSKTKKLDDDDEHKSSNHITSTMSVQEYFAQRMASLKNKTSSGSDLEVRSEDNITAETLAQNVNEQDHAENNSETLKSIKKKKLKSKEQLTSPELVDDDCTKEKTKVSKKKKKSKKKDIEIAQNSNEDDTSVGAKTLKKAKKRKNKEFLDNKTENFNNKKSKQ